MQDAIDKSPQSTRDGILDAAELVFGRKGYFGATIQEIFQIADANRGLLTYYFSTKEGLFAAALERRQEEFHRAFLSASQEMITRTGGRYSLYDVCHLYTAFLMNFAYNNGDGWKNYVTLLAAAVSSYDSPDVSSVLSRFSDIQDRMIGLFEDVLPNADEDRVRRATFYLESSIVTALVSDGLMTLRVGVDPAYAWRSIAADMADFFARGIAAHCS